MLVAASGDCRGRSTVSPRKIGSSEYMETGLERDWGACQGFICLSLRASVSATASGERHAGIQGRMDEALARIQNGKYTAKQTKKKEVYTAIVCYH